MNPKSKRPGVGEQQVVFGQASWRVASDAVEAFVTVTGGQLGPVTFDRRRRKLQPYSVAPWAEEKGVGERPAVIKALRGDFFCLPFGGNATAFQGERHPVHGETANARWQFESLESGKGQACLHLSLETQCRAGRVDKRITLFDGQNVVYCEDEVSGMTGPMSLGHHAMIKFPEGAGSGCVSTSPFLYGQVFPQAFELPEKRGYSFLKAGAEFQSLEAVPALNGETVDVTRYPARRGWEDLLLLVSDPQAAFAWTAVAFPRERFVWFALKDPRVLRETISWISNGGRHYPPWNGRHVDVMGLEEVTSYFHVGLAESVRKNGLAARGFTTHLQLDPAKPLTVRYVMGIAKVAAGFDRVASIEPIPGSRAILLRAQNGREARATVDLDFLSTP